MHVMLILESGFGKFLSYWMYTLALICQHILVVAPFYSYSLSYRCIWIKVKIMYQKIKSNAFLILLMWSNFEDIISVSDFQNVHPK